MRRIFLLTMIFSLLATLTVFAAKTPEVSQEFLDYLTPDRTTWHRFNRDVNFTDFYVDTESVEQTGDYEFKAIFKKQYDTDATNTQHMIELAQRKGVAIEVFLVTFKLTEDGGFYHVDQLAGLSFSKKLITAFEESKEGFKPIKRDAKNGFKAAVKYLPKNVREDFIEYEKEHNPNRKK